MEHQIILHKRENRDIILLFLRNGRNGEYISVYVISTAGGKNDPLRQQSAIGDA